MLCLLSTNCIISTSLFTVSCGFLPGIQHSHQILHSQNYQHLQQYQVEIQGQMSQIISLFLCVAKTLNYLRNQDIKSWFFFISSMAQLLKGTVRYPTENNCHTYSQLFPKDAEGSQGRNKSKQCQSIQRNKKHHEILKCRQYNR